MNLPVFIVGRFPPPADGQSIGTETLAGLLEPLGPVHRVDLSTGDSRHSQIEVRFRPGRVWHYLSAGRRLGNRLKAAGQAPVVWTNMSPSLLGHLRDVLTVVPALARCRTTVAVLHRGTFHTLFESPLTSATARSIVRRISAFVFLDESLSARCAPWIPDAQRFVIPNTIDEAMLYGPDEIVDKQAAFSADRPFRILYLSSMSPLKGYEDVLSAVSLLVDRGRSVTATFAGRWESDRQEADFKAATRELGIAGHVLHLGGVSDRSVIRRLFLEADAFALPTYHPTEAQPISILEALSAATPVITTRQGGIPGMVAFSEEALEVPPRDPGAIAGAVEELLSVDRWNRASRAAQARFKSDFHPDAVRLKWADLLQTLRHPRALSPQQRPSA